jgi:hypothetical protein
MAGERYELPVIEPTAKPRISTDVRAVGKDSRINSAASSSVHFSPISYNTCNTDSTFVSPGLLRQNSVRERPALQGYPKLARFIGERPGFAIFRRFSELNARNLLYLQAELLDVEEELYETEIDDQRDQDLRQLQFSMRGIHNGRVAPEGSKAHSRWKLYEEQRRLLKEYSEWHILNTYHSNTLARTLLRTVVHIITDTNFQRRGLDPATQAIQSSTTDSRRSSRPPRVHLR